MEIVLTFFVCSEMPYFMIAALGHFIYALAGLLLGYVTVSIAESLFHRTLQHSSRRFRNLCGALGMFGRPMIDAHLSHTVVHHGRTYKKHHVQQFRSSAEKIELDRWLMSKHAGQTIILDRYGLSLTGMGIVWFVMPVLLPFTLYVLYLPLSMALASLVFLVIYPCMSIFLHQYLHMTRSDAMNAASRPMRWFLSTRYVKFISRHHYLHHRYIRCNYNLLWLGDYLLGQHRRPSPKDLSLMKNLDMIH